MEQEMDNYIRADNMPTVYHTQQTGRRDPETGAFIPHNTKPAMVFGTIVTMLPSGGDPALAPQPMVNHLERKLKDFTAEDYLLPMGSPAAIAAAGYIAAKNSGGKVRVLIWDNKLRAYYVSELVM